ncbi:MAG: amidohydrolase [Chitinophagaceae bacterium]|nr:MAG: amidohydrolase [Chitinophagaceae bacterium]
MKSLLSVLLLVAANCLVAQPPRKTIVIRNVNLVDVEEQKIVAGSTVQFADGKITVIAKGKTSAKADSVIDGTGKYLMPGLTDAHIHFFQSGSIYTRPDVIDLRKVVPYETEIEKGKTGMADVMKWTMYNGITSVIDVGATYNLLNERTKYKDSNFAPAVFMTGPLLTTYEPAAFNGLQNDRPFSLVKTPEEARKMVQEQLPFKPDFIKIWFIVPGKDKEYVARGYLPVIQAIISEAHKHHLKVAVHATERIAAQLAVENGADFLVHSVDDEVVSNDFVQLLRQKKTVLCPTLVVSHNYNKVLGQDYHFHTTEFEKADPFVLGSLFDLKHITDSKIKRYRDGTRNNAAINQTYDSVCIVNLKKLSDAGVRIAAGTDAGNIGTLHGGSYLPELLAMQAAGMSNWQVLQSATINPAYILTKEKEMGSVAKGKIADMLLLRANPVEDLNHLAKIDLIVNKGNIILPGSLVEETALKLVQRQLNAYNARDLQAFLEPYADDVEIYDYNSGKLLGRGKEQMQKDYAFFKNVPELHCKITARIVQGNIVIDKEHVTGFGERAVEATAIYHIANNKIQKVYFIE